MNRYPLILIIAFTGAMTLFFLSKIEVVPNVGPKPASAMMVDFGIEIPYQAIANNAVISGNHSYMTVEATLLQSDLGAEVLHLVAIFQKLHPELYISDFDVHWNTDLHHRTTQFHGIWLHHTMREAE